VLRLYRQDKRQGPGGPAFIDAEPRFLNTTMETRCTLRAFPVPRPHHSATAKPRPPTYALHASPTSMPITPASGFLKAVSAHLTILI
jgi:hypothetical protein